MIDDKKIEDAKEEIYEDRFLLNGEEVAFDNDAKEEMFYKDDIKEAILYKSNDHVPDSLYYPSGKEIRRNRRMLELRKRKGRL